MIIGLFWQNRQPPHVFGSIYTNSKSDHMTKQRCTASDRGLIILWWKTQSYFPDPGYSLLTLLRTDCIKHYSTYDEHTCFQWCTLTQDSSPKMSCAQGLRLQGPDYAGPTESWAQDLMSCLFLAHLRECGTVWTRMYSNNALKRTGEVNKRPERRLHSGRTPAALRQIEGFVSAAHNNTIEAFNIWAWIQSLPRCLQRGRTNILACVLGNRESKALPSRDMTWIFF